VIVIPPLTLEPAHLLACSIPEVDATMGEKPWEARVWAEGEILAVPDAQLRYKCLAPVSQPPSVYPQYWQLLGHTNRWEMFRHLSNDATVAASPLTFTLAPMRRFNAFFLYGVDAHHVTVVVTVNGVEVRRVEKSLIARRSRTWSDYYFGGQYTEPTVVLHDLPPYSGAQITVTLTRAGGPVRVEQAAVGMSTWLGHATWAPRNDALNFSDMDRDRWGRIVLDPIKSAPTLRVRVVMPKDNSAKYLRVRQQLDAVPALWAALDGDTTDGYAEALSVFGIYRRMPLEPSNVQEAVGDIELESL